jgi:hypothetical protein
MARARGAAAPARPRPPCLLPGRQDGRGGGPYVDYLDYLDITRLTHDTGFAPAVDAASAVADYAWRADNPR